MSKLCEFCKKELPDDTKRERFCSDYCQARHYYRRPEIREKYRLRAREYRKNNPGWREKHRLQQAKYKEKRKLYRAEYFKRPEIKARMRERARTLRRIDPNFAVAERLRRSLRHALDNYTQKGKVMSSKKYWLDIKELIERLKPFPANMKDYEIDHIIPLHTFNLNDTKEIKKAFSPENLRWLTKYENRSKGGRVANSIKNNL